MRIIVLRHDALPENTMMPFVRIARSVSPSEGPKLQWRVSASPQLHRLVVWFIGGEGADV